MSQSSPAHEPRDYSDRDIKLMPLVKFAIGTALFTLLVFAAVRYAMAYWERQARASDAALPELATSTRQLPPTSLLQVDERRDLAAQRAWEASLLTNYAVLDQTAGVVRIPVDRAMELVAQRGLPARTEKP